MSIFLSCCVKLSSSDHEPVLTAEQSDKRNSPERKGSMAGRVVIPLHSKTTGTGPTSQVGTTVYSEGELSDDEGQLEEIPLDN